MSARDITGTTLINHWQRGVPVERERVITFSIKIFGAVAVIGFSLAVARLISPLGGFSGMSDAFAWGIWKTFNVMTLTALGSGPLAVGLAAWVFHRQKLHVVMRTALATGFLFYVTGLIALGVDVGRPWNFYWSLLPWHWNTHSAMLEVALCMPLYCSVFLAFENVPMVLERFYYTGTPATRARLLRWAPTLRRIYPFMLVGAYVLPLMHQSALGGLLLLAGDKINPLWQTPLLPLFYLIAALTCGLAFVSFVLCITGLRYGRHLDLTVLGELGHLLSWLCVGFVCLQVGDLIVRGQLAAAFAFNRMSILLLLQVACILVPGVVLRGSVARQTPRTLLNMSTLACVGGMFYRFIPSTLAFNDKAPDVYFPSVPELFISFGYIGLAIVLFRLAVTYFAVLPGDMKEWNYMFRRFGWTRPKEVRTP